MMLSTFDEFLTLSQQQAEPQRLLFVFTKTELPENALPEQIARYESGQGGILNPVMCVDKLPSEINGFAGLAAESKRTRQEWDVVFAASLSGKGGVAPSEKEADTPLLSMVEAIKNGMIGNYLAIDRDGSLVRFY